MADQKDKMAVAIGAGVAIGKWGGTFGSWVLGGTIAYVLLRTAERRERIVTTAKKGATVVRSGYQRMQEARYGA